MLSKLEHVMRNQLQVDPAPLLPLGRAGELARPKSAGNRKTSALSRSQRISPHPKTPASSSL